jgi:hypothetical protein
VFSNALADPQRSRDRLEFDCITNRKIDDIFPGTRFF